MLHYKPYNGSSPQGGERLKHYLKYRAMTIRPCALKKWETGEWCQPTPDEIRALLTKHGLSGTAAGRIIGVDGRTVRRYTAPVNQKGARDISYSAWRLLLIETGEIHHNCSAKSDPRKFA